MQDRERSWPLPFGDRAELDFTAGSIAVTVIAVTPGESPRLEVTGTVARSLDIDVRKEGDVVKVRLRRERPDREGGGPFWDWGHSARATLHVPTATQVKLRTDVGRVRVEGLSGCKLDFTTSAGTVTLRRIRGHMRLKTGAGKIAGEGLAGSLDVETGAGAIHLGIAALDPGTHSIRSSVGAMRLDLAPGMPVRIDTRTTLGATRNSYPVTPEAPALLQLATEVGSIQVRPASGPAVEDAPRPMEAAAPAAPATPAREASGDELRRVLIMVEQGKLSAEEAEKLLRAMEGRRPTGPAQS